MPIIPLNEEGEGQEEDKIPEELALLPLRNTMLLLSCAFQTWAGYLFNSLPEPQGRFLPVAYQY